MADDTTPTDRAEDLPTVGSGRVDSLFDEIEETIERLDHFGDELESLRRRIDTDEGDTSGHVRDRVTSDADQLSREADAAASRLGEKLERLKDTVE
jgi:hypothetical protein